MKNIDSEIQNLEFWKNDPILRLLIGRWKFSSLCASLVLDGIIIVMIYGLGWVADKPYTGNGMRFGEPRYFLWILLLIIISSLTFFFYTWQPKALAELFKTFMDNKVTLEVAESGGPYINSYNEFLDKLSKTMNSWIWPTLTFILSVTLILLEVFLVFPAALGKMGRSSFWYDTKWFLVIFMIALFIVLYSGWMMIIKQIHAYIYLNRMFHWFNVNLYPLHADEAGGLGKVGNYTLKTSVLLVIIGAGVAIESLAEWIFNKTLQFDLLLFWIIYAVLTPVNFFLPMLAAHRVMKEKRNAELNVISHEITKTLSDSSLIKENDIQIIKNANEKLRELQSRHEFVVSNFPIWPIPARHFRNFSLSALLPLIYGLTSTVLDIYRR
jgi:hypothetical protein